MIQYRRKLALVNRNTKEMSYLGGICLVKFHPKGATGVITAPPPSKHWNSKEKCRILTVPASKIPVEVDESQKINATSAVFEKGNRKVLGRIKIFVLLDFHIFLRIC